MLKAKFSLWDAVSVLFSYPLRMALSPSSASLLLSNFPQSSTFYIVLVSSFLLPNCLRPQALSLHYFLNKTTCTTKLRNHTHAMYGECSCFCNSVSCFLSILPARMPIPFSKPPTVHSPQLCLPCPLLLAIYLTGSMLVRALQRNRTNKIYLERDWF